MKTLKDFMGLLIVFNLTVGNYSCTKGILDKEPVSSFSDASVWSDINLADQYLLGLYGILQSRIGYNMLSDMTSVSFNNHAFGSPNFNGGNLSSSNYAPFTFAWNYQMQDFQWGNVFNYIQQTNVFIEKIEDIVKSYPAERQDEIEVEANLKKGEAIFLRAFCYERLVRCYGGVPIFRVPFKLGDNYLDIKRNTFEETIDFISEQCDSAALLLKPKSETELGRATKEAAFALKSRVLLFAASDLASDGLAENEFVGYKNPDRTQLWKRAKDAAKVIIDLGHNSLEDFGAPDKETVSRDYYSLFNQRTLSSNEIIFGKMYLKTSGPINQNNLIQGSNGFGEYGCSNPTQNMVDFYQMSDGSEFFDHYMIDNNGFYRRKDLSVSENIYVNRDPRFYGSILYDSAIWRKRLPDLAPIDPLGIYSVRTRITIKNGQEISKTFGIDTKSGPVDAEDGSVTGYLMKKYIDDQMIGSETNNNDNVWIEFRYAEIILNYAEACIGLGEFDEATTYINMIRNRAGMPNFTGDITKALRYERKVELIFEGLWWFDIRRWKILDSDLEDARGINIIETKNEDNGTITTTRQSISVEERGPIPEKQLWLPIPIDEINRAPQLAQNPGY